MASYIEPIKTALFIFPIIAFLFTLPYMIYHYRKYGAIPAFRTIVVYSFILYLISAYFLVILPLPPVEKVINSNLPRMQLVPFQFMKDILTKSPLVLSDPSSYLKALGDATVYQVFYNIILLFPFGFYLRYYFKCSWVKTIFYSFLLSLFFEVTQLTGLYGIYPRNYRLFDVDDLIINTFGGLVGYIFTPVISIFLPSRDKLDQESYKRGKQVSYLRRLCSFILDWMIIFITYPFLLILIRRFNLLNSYTELRYVIIIIVYFIVVPMLLHGQTLGKKFFKIKIVRTDGYELSWENYIVRYGILYFFFLPAPFLFLLMLGNIPSTSFLHFILYLGVMIFFLGIFLYGIFEAIYERLTGKRILCYERWSHTRSVSTIAVPTDKIDNETKGILLESNEES